MRNLGPGINRNKSGLHRAPLLRCTCGPLPESPGNLPRCRYGHNRPYACRSVGAEANWRRVGAVDTDHGESGGANSIEEQRPAVRPHRSPPSATETVLHTGDGGGEVGLHTDGGRNPGIPVQTAGNVNAPAPKRRPSRRSRLISVDGRGHLRAWFAFCANAQQTIETQPEAAPSPPKKAPEAHDVFGGERGEFRDGKHARSSIPAPGGQMAMRPREHRRHCGPSPQNTTQVPGCG